MRAFLEEYIKALVEADPDYADKDIDINSIVELVMSEDAIWDNFDCYIREIIFERL